MIPTFNCAAYLRQTLESVLAQDPGAAQMQIEVVDDCSTRDDPEAVVAATGGGRVAFHRKPVNEGAIPNFNTCLERSRGVLVHILHGDDYVGPGFYARLGELAEGRPELALFASRSFLVDEEGVILGVTPRLRELEGGAREVSSFLYRNPLATPGVVVRRAFYEAHGGFLHALPHTADWEMWTRAISLGGGIVTREVLACYRQFASNDSARLARTAANLHDFERLNRILGRRYPAFDPRKGREHILTLALIQAERFARSGDAEAARANRRYWWRHAPLRARLLRSIEAVARAVLG